MNIEYRTLKRDGNCNCCYTTIQKDKDLCIIFDNKKNGAYTIVLCPECIKTMGDKIMELNKELITKETAAEIVQKFYNDASDVPSKFLLSGVRCALLSTPPAPIDFKFDKELVLAHLKRIEQEVYNSAGVPQEYFGGLKQIFQKAEEEILNETQTEK